MLREMRKRAAWIGVGLGAALVAAGLLPLFGDTLRTVLVAGGVLAASAALIAIQLRLYREGDRAWPAGRREGTVAPAPVAPAELRNPKLRTVWESLESMRRVTARLEQAEAAREKARLGLSAEEEILFAADQGGPLSSFMTLLSLSALVGATLATRPAGVGFALLGVGLSGLLYLSVTRGLRRYYLTSHRVLVRTREPLGGSADWTALHYHEIERCTAEASAARVGLRLEGAGVSVELAGLNRTQIARVRGILQEALPARVTGH